MKITRIPDVEYNKIVDAIVADTGIPRAEMKARLEHSLGIVPQSRKMRVTSGGKEHAFRRFM